MFIKTCWFIKSSSRARIASFPGSPLTFFARARGEPGNEARARMLTTLASGWNEDDMRHK